MVGEQPYVKHIQTSGHILVRYISNKDKSNSVWTKQPEHCRRQVHEEPTNQLLYGIILFCFPKHRDTGEIATEDIVSLQWLLPQTDMAFPVLDLLQKSTIRIVPLLNALLYTDQWGLKEAVRCFYCETYYIYLTFSTCLYSLNVGCRLFRV